MKSLFVFVLTMILSLYGVPGAGAGDETLRVIETPAVRVLYETPRQGAALRIKAVSPAMFQELEKATGLIFDFQPTVIPASSRQRFRAMGGRDAYLAFALPERRQVVLDLSRIDARPALFLPVLKHEYAHLLLHRHIPSDRLPRWLDEGIAQHLSDGLSEYLPGRSQMVLGEALATDRVLPLGALETRFPDDSFGRQLAYEQSRSIVGYMVRRYGDGFLTALIGRMADRATVGDAFLAVSAKTLAGFEADWRRSQATPLSWLARFAGHLYGILFFLAGVATLFGYLRHRRRRQAYDAEEEDDAG